MVVENFFPSGLSSYVIGGLLIGFAVVFIFFMTGITAGVSRVYTNLLSFFVRDDFFLFF